MAHEKKHIGWETDEHGLEIGKMTVSTIDAMNRWQQVYDTINALEERVKQLENKSIKK